MVSVQLSKVAKITMGTSPKGNSYNTDGIGLPLLNGPTEFGEYYPTCSLYTTESVRTCKRGDLIFCVRGSTTGRMNWADKIYSLGRGVCGISGKTQSDTFFIKYFIDYRLKALLKFAGGATFPNLTKDTIHNFEIEYLDSREKVVAILQKYDILIQNNSRRIQILESMAKLIYDEWFVKFKFPGHEKVKMVDSELGEIPDGWEVKQIYDIVDIQKGLSYKSENLVDDGKIAFVNLKCFERGGGFRYDGVKRFEGEFKEKHVVRCGDIVVAVTDMTQNREIVARAARIPKLNEKTVIISMDVVKMCPKNGLDKSWLFGLLSYSFFGIKMKEFANGVNVLHLKSEPMGEYQFALPDQKIIDAYSQIVSRIYQEIDNLQLKNMNLAATRDLLLPKLMSGELDVSELDIKVTEVEA